MFLRLSMIKLLKSLISKLVPLDKNSDSLETPVSFAHSASNLEGYSLLHIKG